MIGAGQSGGRKGASATGRIIARGEVVTSLLTRGLPVARLLASPAELVLHPVLLDPIVLHRENAVAVEVRRMRLPLFWQTLLVFRLVDGGRLPEMFVPVRRRRLLRGLDRLGWAVVDGPPVSWREALSRPTA